METQAEVMMSTMEFEDVSADISIPLQTLFDECLNFISVNDFSV